MDWKPFKNYFVGNINAYAIQKPNGKGYTVFRRKINKELIERHLIQDITLGSYPIYYKSHSFRCKWICLDIDLHSFHLENNIEITNSNQIINNGITFPIKIKKNGKLGASFNTQNELLDYYWNRSGLIVYEPNKRKEKYRIECDENEKLRNLVDSLYDFLIKFYQIPTNAICREFSGRGYHIWIKLKDLTTLKRAYDMAMDIKENIMGFYGVDIDEIFPKQSEIKDVKKGLGNFVKLPLSINRKNKQECVILDDDFDLVNQESFEITDVIKKIRAEKKVERHYDPNKTELNLEKWKALTNLNDKAFYDQLRHCLRKVIYGKRQAIGGNGHNIRMAIANDLFRLKAPIETRINAFKRQTDFDFDTTLYQCTDLEMRQRRNNRFYRSNCTTIARWGFCDANCPDFARSKMTEDEIAEVLFTEGGDDVVFGIKGGWTEVRKLFNEKINGKEQTKEYVVKTTRSGTTTNIIVETIENNKKILVIAPTIKICEVTVHDAINLMSRTPSLFRLGSNKELCSKLFNRVINTKELNRFPFLLKENCDECELNIMLVCERHTEYNKKCEDCRKINREREKCNWRIAVEDIEDFDIIYITTAKMFALMKTTDEEAKGVLRKIQKKTVDVIFLDEISSVLDVGSESISYIAEADEMYQTLTPNVDFSSHFLNQFITITPFITSKNSRNARNVNRIWFALEDFIKGVNKMHHKFKDKHLNRCFLIESPLYKTLEYINAQYKEEGKNGSTDSDWLTLYKLLIDYTETTDRYPHYVIKVLLLAKYENIYLQYITPARYRIRLDLLPAKPIREFLDFLNEMAEIKQFFCTDATEPPIKINKLFPNIKMLEIDDPMNTAEKQSVIPYSKPLNLSRIGQKSKSFAEAVKYIKTNGDDNTMIICQNIMLANLLRKKEVLTKNKHYKVLTYFRSPFTIGTPSDCRKIITVGSPYPPKNSHRWLAHLFKSEELSDEDMSLEQLTKHLEYYNAKSTFFQAISRGKDPKGETNSVVFTYGLNKFQCLKLLNFPISVPKVL